MSDIIYIVFRGSRSDCLIAAVFDNRPEALLTAEAIDGYIVPREVISTSPVPAGMKIYSVSRSDEMRADVIDYIDEIGMAHIRPIADYDGYYFYTDCPARDEQQALEIGSERHAFMVATYGTEQSSRHDFGGHGRDDRYLKI